jgi:hypothetical protein
VEYLVRTIIYIYIYVCIGFLFANYSNIADEPTIMTPTNDIKVMGYEQLVPPICYYLCLSRTFLSNYNRYRNERDSFTQLIDLKISSRTVCVILERKHKEIPEILHIHYVQNRFITAHTQLFFHSELCHIYTTKLYATSLHDS